MKLQDVILKAMAKKLSWIEAAEVAGMSVRNMQRKRQAYQEFGYTGLFDQRRGKRSIHRIPMETAERVLQLYQENYFDLSVLHFHEKLLEEHQIGISYNWVKQALQGAGLVRKRQKRGKHRRRRERKPLPGMMLHIDGSKHRWFRDDRYYDLLAILDDATSEVYYAQLVEEESTRTGRCLLKCKDQLSINPGWLLHGNPGGDPSISPPCGAKTRKGRKCRAPAVQNRKSGKYTDGTIRRRIRPPSNGYPPPFPDLNVPPGVSVARGIAASPSDRQQ